MRLRFGVLAVALLVLVAACSSSGGGNNSLGNTTTTVAAAQNAACANVAKTSPEIGVSLTTITVTVIADVNNPIRPGLFQGSWNGMKAWGDYINANGGLACRQVKVIEADSKLSPTDATNAVAQACGNSIATVGTTALFLQDVTPLRNCKDKLGQAIGLPDIAVTQTDAAQQCSPTSYSTLPTGYSCPYDPSKGGLRTFHVGYTQYDYYFNKYGANALHGAFVIPKDLPSTIAATMPIFRAENRMGIKSDYEKGKSGTDTQAAYTEVAQAIKQHNSTYARNGLDYQGTVAMRQEAAVQGVNTVKVWDCSLQCYDKRLLASPAVDGQYVWVNFLPFEDGNANAELANFLKYDKSPDGFGAQAWIAGEIFAQAVKNTVAAHNNDPNSITRTNLLASIKAMHSFDAGGMIPKIDVGNRIGTTCLVGMQVQKVGGVNKFVRIDPTQPGTFDCDNNKPAMTLTIDPAAEYHG
jgi:ABC-type branched-subunit amino acid transport system substrate-binding protein